MSDDTPDTSLDEINEAFQLMGRDPLTEFTRREFKQKEQEWKEQDPEGYKKDMEKMCREMFGDKWEVEYQAMLREEFPNEYP
jgi:hypothetical protein